MTMFFGRKSQAACRVLFLALLALGSGGIAQAALEITEIMYDPRDEFVWEWIEVRNTDPNAVDLDGWLAFNLGDLDQFNTPSGDPSPTIDKNLAANTIIPGNSVAIIYDGTQAGFTGFPSFEPNDASFRSAWGLSASVPVIAANFFPSLNNDPDPNDPTPPQSIGFWKNLADYDSSLATNPSDPNGPKIVGSFVNTQFSLNFNTGFPNAPNGSSITWKGIGSNSSGANWLVSDPNDPGQSGVVVSSQVQVVGNVNNTDAIANPGEVPNGSFSTLGLHITEFMYDPPESNEVAWEWIEIYNNSGSTINMAGYVVDDGNGNRAAPTAANIAAGSIDNGGTAILVSSTANITDFKAAWGASLNVIPVTGWSNMQMNNDTDVIAIWDSYDDYDDPNQHTTHTNAVARQRYNEATGFPAPANSASIYLSNLSLDPNDGELWAAANLDDDFRFADNSGSFNASGVAGPGGMITFHPGGDIGSPGFFEVVVPDNANFDGDEDVDGNDFLIWQRNFGIVGGASLADGDANGDGNVDAADLAVWETQYGTTGLLQGIAAVPEPTSFVLCGLALAPWALRRRRG